MSIEFTETVTRQCCEWADRKPYKGLSFIPLRSDPVEFCSRCGQLWAKTWSRFDGAEHYLGWEKIRPAYPERQARE